MYGHTSLLGGAAATALLATTEGHPGWPHLPTALGMSSGTGWGCRRGLTPSLPLCEGAPPRPTSTGTPRGHARGAPPVAQQEAVGLAGLEPPGDLQDGWYKGATVHMAHAQRGQGMIRLVHSCRYTWGEFQCRFEPHNPRREGPIRILSPFCLWAYLIPSLNSEHFHYTHPRAQTILTTHN